MANLFDNTVDVIAKSMDMRLTRHSVISDNIANAETPFFKARRVDFEESLQKAVESQNTGTFDRSVSSVVPMVSEDIDSEVGQDRNTVDMDREMAAMNKNEVRYSAAAQAIAKKFALLRYAISEGTEK